MSTDLKTTIQVSATTEIPVAEILLRTSRSSGPGGQNVNKLATKVLASFDVYNSPSLNDEQKYMIVQKLGPVVTATAQDTRSQLRNKEAAIERIREKIEAALIVPKKRKKAKASQASKAKRVEGKRRQGDKKKQRQRPEGDF